VCECDYLTTASAAHYTIADWWLLYHSGIHHTRPWHINWLWFVDADACKEHGIMVFCLVVRAMPDSQMCTASHSPDDVGCLSTLQNGQWEWCIGQPPGLPDVPTLVSPQCSCAIDFPIEIQRPYYPVLLLAFIACGFQSRCSTNSLSWHIKYCMVMHWVTVGHLSALPMCLVAKHSILPAWTASMFHQSCPPPLAVKPS